MSEERQYVKVGGKKRLLLTETEISKLAIGTLLGIRAWHSNTVLYHNEFAFLGKKDGSIYLLKLDDIDIEQHVLSEGSIGEDHFFSEEKTLPVQFIKRSSDAETAAIYFWNKRWNFHGGACTDYVNAKLPALVNVLLQHWNDRHATSYMEGSVYMNMTDKEMQSHISKNPYDEARMKKNRETRRLITSMATKLDDAWIQKGSTVAPKAKAKAKARSTTKKAPVRQAARKRRPRS